MGPRALGCREGSLAGEIWELTSPFLMFPALGILGRVLSKFVLRCFENGASKLGPKRMGAVVGGPILGRDT